MLAYRRTSRPQANLHSLQADKQPLVRNLGRVRVSLTQLIDTVRAPREDERDSQGQEPEEDLLALRELARVARPRVTDHVVGEDGAEDDDHDDLDDEAAHGQIDAQVRVALGVGADGAAGGLDHQARHVQRDEDPVERLGGQACEFGPEVGDAVGMQELESANELVSRLWRSDTSMLSFGIARLRSRVRGGFAQIQPQEKANAAEMTVTTENKVNKRKN